MKKKKQIRKINRKKGHIPAEIYHKIFELYWDENYEQPDLSKMFDVDQGHISRIVNGKAAPYQNLLFKKQQEMELNIIPSPSEPPQAKTLRAKREQLPITKLTWNKVEKLRSSYFSGEKTQQQLATQYGINQSTITKITRGLKWKLIK